MKKIIIITLTSFTLGFGTMSVARHLAEDPPYYVPVKPYAIIDKDIRDGYAKYTYVDANGLPVDFSDNMTRYSVGDTIR